MKRQITGVFIIFGVMMFVYNNQGQITGKIVDNVIDETLPFDPNNPLIAMAEGEAKILIFAQRNNYKTEITAANIGIMSYVERRIDENGISRR